MRSEAVNVLPPDRPGGWAWDQSSTGPGASPSNAGRVPLQSRQQRQLTRYFPEVVAAVVALGREVR
jgi:hypothetical protein